MIMVLLTLGRVINIGYGHNRFYDERAHYLAVEFFSSVFKCKVQNKSSKG